MAVQSDLLEAAGPYDRAKALSAFKLGDITFYWITRLAAISVLLILGGIIVSLIIAILPNLPGFLATVKLVDPASVPAFFVRLYDYAWFVGFAIAFVSYLTLRRLMKVASDG